MKGQIFEVENPVRMSKEEIESKYYDRQVLVTNIQRGNGTWASGIVRYYAIHAMRELWARLNELDNEIPEGSGIAGVWYIAPIPLNLYAGS